jgi:hypothetical protein
MSQTSNPPQPRSGSPDDHSLAVLREPLPAPARKPSTTFQNWGYFGASIMGFLGASWAGLGLIALVDEQYLSPRTNGLIDFETYTTWGWVHLLGGSFALVAAVGILWGGHRWARLMAIVVAGLSAVVNFGFLGDAPVWAMLLIGLDVVVIYALTVHGAEIDAQ